MSRSRLLSLLSFALLLAHAAACSSSDPSPADGAPSPDTTPTLDGAPATDSSPASDSAPSETIGPAQRFSATFGATEALRVTAVAGDGAGGAVVVGSFAGTLNLGGGPLVSAGGSDIFVGAFDASGAHRLSFRLGSDGQKLRPALPSRGLLLGKSQIGLVDQGGSLKRVPRRLTPHVVFCQGVKLFVDGWNKVVQRGPAQL